MCFTDTNRECPPSACVGDITSSLGLRFFWILTLALKSNMAILVDLSSSPPTIQLDREYAIRYEVVYMLIVMLYRERLRHTYTQRYDVTNFCLPLAGSAISKA